MSNPNYDNRYTKPADVDAKIAAQAATDAGQYVSINNVANASTPAGSALKLAYDPRETLGTKLRRLSAQARQTDPYILPALAPAPVWVPSTAYLVGSVVTNGGNAYICIIAGTSASSGGPTTMLAAIQSDGSVSWAYMGPTMATITDQRAPVYSSSASVPSGLTNIFSPGTSPNYFKVYGAAGVNAGGSLLLSRFQSASGTTAYGDARVSFWTDAPKFVLDVAASNQIRIRIDGQFYSQANLNMSSSVSYHTFDFTTAGGRRPRLIDLEFRISTAFRTLRVSSTDQVWPVSDVDKVRAVWISDSLFAGSSYGPFTQSTAQIAGAKLGWRDSWNFSAGGTGWLNGSPSYTFGERIPQALALSPDVWCFVGSINDVVNYTSTQITAAVQAGLQSVRNGGSTAPIIVFGMWSAESGSRTQTLIQSGEAAIQAGVTSFADPLGKTFFIPIANDPVLPWITTANNNSARTTSNNLTQIVANDGTHPTEYGTLYYADRIAAAIRSNVLPILA